MPNTKSAEKRARQAEARTRRNRAQRSRMKTAIKKVLQAKEADEATAAYRESAALLDRYATRRLIHPNKAARQKSRLAKYVKAVGGTP